MGTFTIYNCGTGYDETNRDLITKLFEKTQGARGTDKLICAGPGSKLMTRPDYDPTLHPSRYSFQTSVFTPVKNAYQGMGKLTGATDAVKQVEFNVAAVLKILKGLRIKPDKVNMAGWSRGACTCHAIANAMDHDEKDTWLKGVEVNIFAVDPVPGTFHEHKHDWITVPGNVKNYEVVFMENETRWWCKAAELSIDSPATKRTLLHLPGFHWSGVELNNEVPSHGPVTEIASHLAVRFLKSCGTPFMDRTMIMSDDRLLEDYALLIENTPNFFGGNGAIPGQNEAYRLTGKHESTFKIQNHLLSSSPYFVNTHHKQVFKRFAPTFFKYVFVHQIFNEFKSLAVYMNDASKELQNDRRTIENLWQDLMSIQRRAPHTYATLEEFAKFVGKTRAKAIQHQKAKVFCFEDILRPDKWFRRAA